MLQPSIESWGELFLRSMEHHFNVELATLFGVEKAIIIHNLYFWINHNAKNKVHIHDGSVWTFNSSSAFAKLFPYIKERTISRYLVELEKSNIIITGNYNINSFDKTKWYAFSVPFLSELEKLGYDITDIDICQNVQFDTHKMANGYTQNSEPIPYNKQADSKQEENEEERDKSLSKKKAKFDVYADLSYVDAEYADIWKEWLEYKDAINKQYKTQKGANMQYSSMIRMSDNNPVLANAIVKRSIEMSWDGLSSLTDKQKKFFLSDRSPYYSNDICGKHDTKPSLPKGWEQERYDMYIRNGYTITEDGRLFKDGREIK